MKSISMSLSLCVLCACATSRPDRFYILATQPANAGETRTAAPTAQAALKVTLPSLVDRPEIVISTSAERVAVLEHERWAAPLIDLITQTLARDIEQRRPNLLVGERNSGGSIPVAYKFSVDIVQVTLRRGGSAGIEAHWRMIGTPNLDLSGGGVFSVPLSEEGYAPLARALSKCLGALADRLTEQLPR